jgi:hypothetical protein
MTSSTTTNNDACWTVGIEPPVLWYKHVGRLLTCSFVDTRNIPIEDKWKNNRIWLVYNDTLRLVVSTDQDNEQPIRGFRQSVSTDGTTLNCSLRIMDLTKNHGGRPFCLYLTVGDNATPEDVPLNALVRPCFMTASFSVKTRPRRDAV